MKLVKGEIRYCDTSKRAFLMKLWVADDKFVFQYGHGIVNTVDPLKIEATLTCTYMKDSKLVNATQIYETAIKSNSRLRCLKKFKQKNDQ